ncbi:DUF7453 family protein [Aeoliella sp.]|uniref:DUF7453 family protein n=1 Tax=Aeoliella sp. TaxID=2795800 RepID=UPI003CCBA1D5
MDTFTSNYRFLSFVLLACLSGQAVVAADLVRTVALSDVPIRNDTQLGIRKSGLSRVVVDARGNVAFEGFLTGPGVNESNDRAILSESVGNGLRIVAREGFPLPDSPAESRRLLSANFFSLNNIGDTLVLAALDGPEIIGVVAATRTDGRTDILLREGDMPTGQSEVALASITSVGVNGFSASGNFLAARGTLRGPNVTSDNDNILYRLTESGSLDIILREGDPLPATTAGEKYGRAISSVAINQYGHLAFLAEVDDPRRIIGNDTAVFGSSISSQPLLIAREGLVAPGFLYADVFYDDLGSTPVVGPSGEVVFHAELRGATTSRNAIFRGDVDDVELVIKQGDAFNNGPDGLTLFDAYSLVVNSKGHLAFNGEVAGIEFGELSGEGVFKEDTVGEIAIVALAGQQAPGVAQGERFYSFQPVSTNRLGQTAFEAWLTQPLTDRRGRTAIFAEDIRGNLQLIVAAGEEMNVSDDPFVQDLRTVTRLVMTEQSGNADGRRSGFNDLGQLAFYAEFTDGSSGFFVANAVAVAEPSSIVTTTIAVACFVVACMSSHEKCCVA